jgi:hypothetical protein
MAASGASERRQGARWNGNTPATDNEPKPNRTASKRSAGGLKGPAATSATASAPGTEDGEKQIESGGKNDGTDRDQEHPRSAALAEGGGHGGHQRQEHSSRHENQVWSEDGEQQTGEEQRIEGEGECGFGGRPGS